MCNCGYEDCRACHPEHFGAKCEVCGEEINYNDDAPEGLCLNCYSNGWQRCEDCGCIWQETDDVQSCPDCASRSVIDTPDSEVAERFAAYHRKQEREI